MQKDGTSACLCDGFAYWEIDVVAFHSLFIGRKIKVVLALHKAVVWGLCWLSAFMRLCRCGFTGSAFKNTGLSICLRCASYATD